MFAAPHSKAVREQVKVSNREVELDWSEELAKARNILRQFSVAGKQRDDVPWALDKLKELSERGNDISLEFECKRWNTTMAGCKGGEL